MAQEDAGDSEEFKDPVAEELQALVVGRVHLACVRKGGMRKGLLPCNGANHRISKHVHHHHQKKEEERAGTCLSKRRLMKGRRPACWNRSTRA